MILALFFTRGVSLKIWIEKGLFDREKLIYEEHLKRGNLQKVYWITYGSGDREIADELKRAGKLHKDIEILPMPKVFNSKFGKIAYSFLIPFIHRKVLRQVDILKTNQMSGSWSAVFTKWIYKKPLIVRTGYTASLFIKRLSKSKFKHKIYELMERFAYKNCELAIVASKEDKGFICSKYKINPEKVYVVYNYIDTEKFHPFQTDEKYDGRIVFVGRLTSQKNLFNLIKAITELNLTLDIYGSGELEEKLKKEAKRLRAKVNFCGVVPNSNLPAVLNKYKYFILPSYFEGMPKSLLEAMACGLLCIGTDVEGIREVIEDGKTGILAKGTDAASIAKALKKAVSIRYDTYAKISSEAKKWIKTHFSLDSCVKKEYEIFKILTKV